MALRHGWWRVTLFLLLALLTRVLCAGPAKPPQLFSRGSEELFPIPAKTRAAPGGRVAPAAPVLSERLPAHSAASNWILSMGAGLAVVDQHVGWVMHWGMQTRALAEWPLYVGADVGVHYWNRSPAEDQNGSLTGLQALATATWQFVLSHRAAQPYLGISAGPFFRNYTDSPLGLSISAVLRPGITFPLSDAASLGIEPRIGLLEGSFLLQGQASAVFFL